MEVDLTDINVKAKEITAEQLKIEAERKLEEERIQKL